MIALLMLVLVIGGAFVGKSMGCFRAAAVASGFLLAGLAAFNWGLPVSDALAASSRGTAMVVLVMSFGGLSFAIIATALWLTPGRPRMPWLLDDAGGVLFGMFAGWLIAGMLGVAARLQPSFDELIRKGRPNGDSLITCPDAFWLRSVAGASTGGLSAEPSRAFDPESHFLKRSGPPDFPSTNGTE